MAIYRISAAVAALLVALAVAQESPSASDTASVSSSASVTQSMTATMSPSGSPSPTASVSGSGSASQTKSVAASKTSSKTATSSRSYTPTLMPSRSGTGTAAATTSATPSNTIPSRSQTGSRSRTVTPTFSRSAKATGASPSNAPVLSGDVEYVPTVVEAFIAFNGLQIETVTNAGVATALRGGLACAVGWPVGQTRLVAFQDVSSGQTVAADAAVNAATLTDCAPAAAGGAAAPRQLLRGEQSDSNNNNDNNNAARELRGGWGIQVTFALDVPAESGGQATADSLSDVVNNLYDNTQQVLDGLTSAGFFAAVVASSPSREAEGLGNLVPRVMAVVTQPSPAPTPSSTPQCATRTVTPTASLVWRSASWSVVVVRVGDDATNTGNAAVGSALPVYLDYYDTRDGALWQSLPLPKSPSSSSASRAACTLSYGDVSTTGAGRTSWFWDTEGLPSNSDDGQLLVLPCHNVRVGAGSSSTSGTLSEAHSLAVLRPNGTIEVIPFAGFGGHRGSATGLRQAATLDGSGFWLAGAASSNYGIRYLARGGAASDVPVKVHGAQTYSDASFQPGTRDVRGIGIGDGGSELVVSSAALTEPAWGGLVRVRDGLTGLLPRTAARNSQLLPGFNGGSNMWAFLFESRKSVWAVLDGSTYAAGASSDVSAFLARYGGVTPTSGNGRPLYYRTALSSSIAHYAFADPTTPTAVGVWKEVREERITIPDAVYSITGRREGADTNWMVLYTASRDKLYRIIPDAKAVDVIAQPAAGQLFRGAALLPLTRRTPSKTPSASPTRRVRSPSRTRTRKPRV